MPFKMAPQAIPDNFNWRSHLYHFTYRGKMTKRDMMELVQRATSVPLHGWSLCQEDTSYEDENGVRVEGYIHSHVGLIFSARLNMTGSRKFDWHTMTGGFPDVIHPHVQPKINMIQMEQVFVHYHAGRKFDLRKNCMVFSPPLLHEYKLPADFEWTQAIVEEVIAAPTFVAAVIAGQVRPRSFSDVKILREESSSQARKTFVHKYKITDFKLPPPPEIKTLHVWGGSGLGKTKWCLALLRNPCYVKPFNSIGCLEELGRRFDAEMHDGIILDEVDLHFLTREKVIALVDFEEESTIDVRYKSFTIPAGVKKILISNPPPLETYPECKFGAIRRRVQEVNISSPTWLPGDMGRVLTTPPLTVGTQANAMHRVPLGTLSTGQTALARVPTSMMQWRARTTPP